MIRHRTATCAVVLAAVLLVASLGRPTTHPPRSQATSGPQVASDAQPWPVLPQRVSALKSGGAVEADLRLSKVERAQWEAAVVAWQMAETLGRVKAQAPAAAASTNGPPPGHPAQGQVSDQSHPDDSGVFDRLARCEASGNWAANTGNGYYGGLQFTASSWRGVGGQGMPHQASRDTQIEMGRRLQARQGWGAWPHCSRAIGLR